MNRKALSNVATLLRMNPMHMRPAPGRHVTVQMKDGRLLDCSTGRVISSTCDAIMIYHRRHAIDETLAQGWIYAPGPKG